MVASFCCRHLNDQLHKYPVINDSNKVHLNSDSCQISCPSAEVHVPNVSHASCHHLSNAMSHCIPCLCPHEPVQNATCPVCPVCPVCCQSAARCRPTNEPPGVVCWLQDVVVETLRSIAELMIWGDQHDQQFFE